MKLSKLIGKNYAELRKIAAKLDMENYSELSRRDLIMEILEARDAKTSGHDDKYITVEGILEHMNGGTYGLLRTDDLLGGDYDVYVTGAQIKRFDLRSGDEVTGKARLPRKKGEHFELLNVEKVYGRPASEAPKRKSFSKMTPIFPDKQIKLETGAAPLSTRIMDLLCPVGFGQRGMIVSSPKAGKTRLLQEVAYGIVQNYPDVKLMVVLVGERPEEVTDMKRNVKGEVFASNFDEKPKHNCQMAEVALEKAKRMVEWGEDVVMLMDSITRLARAYNITMPTSGKTLSGGFDPVALFPPKRFFGAARNFEDGGSLTILATALVDTGSRMDDLIYEEFKGTGNMEIHLDRKLANRRIYPAIDVTRSSTRNEELLFDKDVLNQSWRVRRMLEVVGKDEDPTELLVGRMKRTKSNKEFLATLHEASVSAN